MAANSIFECTDGKTHVSCKACGVSIYVWPADIKRGYGKYCGKICKQSAVRKHGLNDKRAEDIGQNSYFGAMMRCHNPENPDYPEYGGRGLEMCDRWRFGEGGKVGIECFFEDMGPRPTANHSIERTDNDKGYAPGNCTWATRKTQVRNRRNTRGVIRGDGVRYVNIGEAAEANGIGRENIRSVCRGLSQTAGGHRWSHAEE